MNLYHMVETHYGQLLYASGSVLLIVARNSAISWPPIL